MKRNSLILLSCIVAGGMSCDRPATPLTTGSISVHLAIPPGARVVAPGNAGVAIANASAVTSVTLDSVRVTLAGPTAKAQVFKNAVGGFFEVSMDALTVGSYTVTVEGLSAGAVAYYGQTANVGVTAGQSTSATISFPSFQPSATTTVIPDTVDVLQFGVSFDAVTNATGYIVQWSKSPTMDNASSKVITTTSTVIDVPDEATYWVTVKATNTAIPNGGRATDPKAVVAFQGVAAVTVTPNAPTIAFGATQQFVADSKDANNNTVPSVAYLWVSSNPNVAIVSQTGLATAVGPGTTTITAVGKGTPGSVSLTVGPAPTTKLVFAIQPSSATAGAAIAPALQVAVQNAAGQVVTSDNTTQITIAIATNPSSGTLTGTATATASSGVATFGPLSINKTGTGYTLTATATNVAAANTGAFNVNAGAASKLVFSVQPSGTTTAGDAMSPAVQVEIQDALGNRVSTARDEITLAIATNPSIGAAGVLTGTKKVNAIDGVASFTGLWINKTGTGYTLAASAATVANGATSTGFGISPGAPTKLNFGQQPSNVQGNVALAPAVTVVITDQYDNATPATNSVTLAIGSNPWKSIFSTGAAISATTLTVAAVSGTATFANVRIDKPSPGYTLAATSGLLSAAASSPFNVTLSVQPDTLPNIKLTGGGAHTCAIMTSGSTYCWGANYSGQLGAATGNISSDSIAALVRDGAKPTTINFVTVSAGDSHSCGITSDSLAYCWGNNGSGQLGDGTFTSAATPVLVSGNLRFKSIAAGGIHTCAVTGNGSTVATKSQVYCWGYNGLGQVGDSASSNTVNTPVRVKWPDALKKGATGDTGVKVLQLTAGYYHTCVTVATFAAYCWGYDYYGQLGDGVALSSGTNGGTRIAPAVVAGGFTWNSISAGQLHTCGVVRSSMVNNGIYCWGRNANGQVGDNTGGSLGEADNKSSPVVVSALNWVSVSAGGSHTCGILRGPSGTSGAAYCWGNNTSGQLGIGNTTSTFNAPQAVSGDLVFASITAGGSHNCGRTTTGVYCWGYGGNGQLGSPGSQKNVPTLIVQ